MNLDFDTLVIDEFKSFTAGKQIIRLTQDTPGVTFVQGRNEAEPSLGPNGAAKSSIIDAIMWCLYGRTVKSLKNPDVIPWVIGGSPYVSLVLYINNRRRKVSRQAKPNKLLLDGEEASQDVIDRLVGMPFEIAEHAIVLGQKKDLFLDLSPKAKMEVLSTAINLDRWEEYSDKARDRSRDLEKTLIEIDTELAAKTSLRNQGEQQLKTAKTRSSEWAAELKAQQKSLEERLKTINVSLTSQRNKLDDAELIYDGSGTELKALEQEIRRMQQTRDEAQKEYSKVELMLEGLEDVVGALKTELDGLGRDKDPCPTCGQSLKGTALAHHKREIEQSITKHKATIKTGVPTAIRTKLEVCVEELAKATEHADVFRDKVDDAQTTIRVVGPDVARLETTSRDLQRQLKEHEDTVNPHRAQVEELNKLLRKLDEQIEDLEDEQKDTTKTLTQTKFWVTGFKDVRLSLLQEFLHELELAANALLPESGLHNWRILFDIEKETNKGTIKPGLTVFIQSPSNKEPVRWESWSGGEAQRLRLVGSLALAEVLLAYMGVNTNLEILDEPTNGLSVSGVEDLCEFLARRAKKLDKDIFFIDHMATANRHFSNTFTVVKNKKGSYIE